MDSLPVSSESSSLSLSSFSLKYTENTEYSSKSLVIEKTLLNDDSVKIDFSGNGKSLIITAQEIVKKLNELLKDKVPNGIESLKQEDYTAEATSTRIVQGATAFFGVYKEQNPELSDEELLDKFMETIKGGIQQGYDDAFETLKGLGAFGIDGVQSGVEQTKILIDQKLEAFYQAKRKELGLSTDTESQVQDYTSGEILKQAGTQSLSVTA